MHGKARVVMFGGGRLYREALKRLLHSTELDVESEWDDPHALIAHLREFQPDLVIAIGEHPPGLLSELRAVMKSARLVQLAPGMTLSALRQALRSGVDAYLVDGVSPRALRAAIGLVLQGEKVLPTQLVSLLLSEEFRNGWTARTHWPQISGLSSRELEILGRLVDGEPNKVIASQLDISEATVKVHLKTALRKIKVENRTQAAIWALQHGLRPPSTRSST